MSTGEPHRRVLELAPAPADHASVLSVLPSRQTDYVFTDVSPLFSTRGAQKFGQYPFVRYHTLDIERDPEAQGFASHLFDIVLAANVLHATTDLRQTMRHVKQLLAPGGMLVLLEGTAPERAVDLTFGLMEGWWKFSDRDLRPDHPLFSRQQWRALPEAEGFSDATALPDLAAREASQQAVPPHESAARHATRARRRQPGDGGRLVDLADDRESHGCALLARAGACISRRRRLMPAGQQADGAATPSGVPGRSSLCRGICPPGV